MTKYCIKFEDVIFHGVKKEHKKLKLWFYERYVSFSAVRDCYSIMLFDTSLQAKLWIIRNSSLPLAAEYLSSFCITESIADKIIAKGHYLLSKVYFSDTYEGDIPMLCQLIVDEYEL